MLKSKEKLDNVLGTLLGTEKLIDKISVDFSTIARFSQSIDWPKALQIKDSQGKRIAPPTMIFEVNCNFNRHVNAIDGSYEALQIISQFGQVIRAGNDYEIFGRIKEGDKITVYRTFGRFHKRRGKNGDVMTFIDATLRYINQDGNVVGINHESLILLPNKIHNSKPSRKQ